jgi:hypothetical protein
VLNGYSAILGVAVAVYAGAAVLAVPMTPAPSVAPSP